MVNNPAADTRLGLLRDEAWMLLGLIRQYASICQSFQEIEDDRGYTAAGQKLISAARHLKENLENVNNILNSEPK